MERECRGAVEAGDLALAGRSYRSMLGVLLRCGQPGRAIDVAMQAADCFFRAGDEVWANHMREFARRWSERIAEWPDVDWGEWVRSG